MIDESALYLGVIALSLVVLLLAYVKVSLRDESWINGFSFVMGPWIVAVYVLEAVRIASSGSAGYTPFALIFVYTMIPLYYWSMAFGYTAVRVRPLQLFGPGGTVNARAVAYALQALAWLTLLPVLVAMTPYLSSPRAVYVHVHFTNLGLFFLISSLLARLGLIAFLVVPRRSFLETFAYVSLALVNVVMHGSQGQIVSALSILLLMRVYVRHKPIGFGSLVLLVLAGLVLLMGFMTYLANPEFLSQQWVPDAGTIRQGFVSLGAYSDYVSDTARLIDLQPPPRLGVVTFESNFLTLIPRALWATKPVVFGLMSVSAQVRPLEFLKGYFPAFVFGEEVSDFGVFALAVVMVEGFFAGLMMNACRRSLNGTPSIFSATTYLYFASIPLLTTGMGSTLIAQMIVGGAADLLARVRFFPRAERAMSLPASQATPA